MKLAFVAISLFLFSCGHHRDVRPGAKGIHKVRVQADDKRMGARDALEQANHFCGERNRSAAILKEKYKYIGDMDESTYRTSKRVSKAAQVLGGNLWGLGSREKTQKRGKATMLGGETADQILGQGYQVLMYFKCV